TLRRPLVILTTGLLVFAGSLLLFRSVTKTFLAPQDMGEFIVALDLPPGTSLDAMTEAAHKVEETLLKNPEVKTALLTVGNQDGEANVAEFFVELVPSKQRPMNTSQFKARVREQLKPLVWTNPKVKEIDLVGGGLRPFNVNLIGDNQEALEKF